MSLFLGKIHYWLFNKILWFEGLEDKIIELAQKQGLNIDKLKEKINLKHGEKLPNKKLEEIIDTGNIHGWLQSKIHSSEGRMAMWTAAILDNDSNSLIKLEEIYKLQGLEAAKEVKSMQSITNAKEIYNSINDYILDGMPCDRVNEVIILEDEIVQWKRRTCVHKDIWEKESLNVDIFYNLRDLWIKAFVNELNHNFEYKKGNEEIYSIEIKK